jgi:hypothetical protein
MLAENPALAAPPTGSGAGERTYDVTEEGDVVQRPMPRPAAPPSESDSGQRGEQTPELQGAAASVAVGAFLPMTQTPVVGPQRSQAFVIGGYEGARQGGLIDSHVEANIWDPIAIRVGVSYESSADETLPSAGVRVQLLTQKKHEVELGIAGFYQPKDFREEGNLVAQLSAARRFDRVMLFASTGFESDPEGDDRMGELGSAALFRLNPQLFAGLEARYRRDLASDDEKRFGHSEPVFDLRAGPLLEYAWGPLAVMAQAGLIVTQTLNDIGTPDQKTEERAGVLALGGFGGAL